MLSESAETGVVRPEEMLSLDAIKRRLGWGNHALREARHNGLKVRYVGVRGYLLGKDVIEYVVQHGRDFK
jgi:hypothetical protein